jgi:iron(III) transport system substrate-binding protein
MIKKRRRIMIRKSLLFVLPCLLVFAGTVYSQTKQTSQSRVAEIVKAAEKEGEVIWTHTYKDDEIEPFLKAFNKDYPKIKVVSEREHGVEAMERLVRETDTGTQDADVVQIHAEYVNQFLDRDVFIRENWADFNVVPQLVMGGGQMMALTSSSYVIVYNQKLLKKEDSPKSWEDLLDPKWKGKFVVDSRPTTFYCLSGVWGTAKVIDYAKKLGQNKPVFERGQTQLMNLMAAGNYMMSATSMWSSAIYIAQKGGDLAWNPLNPQPIHLQPVGIVKTAKHPNASKVFVGWLGSKGYKVMDDINWGRSVPFGGTRIEKELKGKTLSFPPSSKQLPAPKVEQLYKDLLTSLGARK